MTYAVITEELDDPQNNEVLVYPTRAAAEAALRQYLTYLQAAGAMIEGDQASGYVARWSRGDQAGADHAVFSWSRVCLAL